MWDIKRSCSRNLRINENKTKRKHNNIMIERSCNFENVNKIKQKCIRKNNKIMIERSCYRLDTDDSCGAPIMLGRS